MARPKSNKVSVAQRHGNQDISAIKSNYEKAQDALKRLYDPSRSSATTLTSLDRERIRGYLQAPANNESGLRDAARYLYIRNQVFNRLVHWYASMWDLRCRIVTPDYTLVKDNDTNKVLKQFENTLKVLDSYHLHGNWHDIAIRSYIEDIIYAIFFRDGENAFFYILDPSECKVDGEYFTGDLSFSMDMSKWRSAQRQELAEWLGDPIQSMVNEYNRTGERWIHMPDEYAACFKFNHDRLDLIFPPFAPLLQAIAGLNDVADLQALKDEASVYKLLLVPMKILSGSNESDNFEITPDLLLEYYDKLLGILPEYVAAAPIPGEITNDNVIDFSTTSADKDIDRLQQSQDTVLATSGGGAVLNANMITSTAAFNAWLKAETEYAISSLMPQIEGFTNRMLSYDVSGNPAKVKYFEVSVYTKKELADDLLKQCQYSYSYRLALGTLYGFSEWDTLALEYMETEVLELPLKMNHPLSSSFTSSGNNVTDVTDEDGGEGRPPLDDTEVTTDGDRSRNR